jgi:magnesium chelatase accessory protein
MIRNTGSKLDAIGIEFYRRLFRSPVHVSAALGMMANWDLTSVVRDLPRLEIPLILVTASGDLAVSPDEAHTICRLTSRARRAVLSGGGHLVHEEAPAAVAEMVLAAYRDRNPGQAAMRSHLQASG